MKTIHVSPSKIIVPHYVTREPDAKADARDKRSIQTIGLQVDLQCVADGEKLVLIDGLRRLRIAHELELAPVPVIVQPLKKGYDLKRFISETRIRLNFHRQDLTPSQMFLSLKEQKERFGLTNRELALARGLDEDTITNYMAVGNYIPPVVEALDAGVLTMRAARAFDGLTPDGQEKIYTAHFEQMATEPSRPWHKELRAKYPPTKHPAMYRDPEKIARRLNRPKQARQSKNREKVMEVKKLETSLRRTGAELERLTKREKALEAACIAARPIAAAFQRIPELRAKCSEGQLSELQLFSERWG